MSTPERVVSFAPIARSDAERLILGTMPGRRSLADREYYAHPQNAFWRVVKTLFGIESATPYAECCTALIKHRIAVWDVLHACVRVGSLDSEIVESSVVPNDFARFFETHTRIRAVYFNGAKAHVTYQRHVVPKLPPEHAEIPQHRLPSTSPANASIPFGVKLEAWRAVTQLPRPV